jgi:hypothetical protein
LLGLGCAESNDEGIQNADLRGVAATKRLGPATRRSAFARDFPPLPALRVAVGSMRLEGAALAGLSSLRFFYYAPSPRQWRLMACRGNRSLLDLADRDGYVTVLDYRSGTLMQGSSPVGGSSLAGLLKWDPAMLYSALTLGQALGRIELRPVGDAQAGPLRPTRPAQAGGLDWALLDPATGLPDEAHWTGDGRAWRARYRQWSAYPRATGDAGANANANANVNSNVNAGAATQIMPARVTLTDDATGVVVDVQAGSYVFGPPVAGVADPFTPVLTYSPRRRPMTELEKALQ